MQQKTITIFLFFPPRSASRLDLDLHYDLRYGNLGILMN
jgi:hypothetical protein